MKNVKMKNEQKTKQGAQGLQTLTICLLTVNDEHAKQTLVQKKA